MSYLTKDYRNCRYQGLGENLEPHGEGILLDDNLRFIVGTWIHSQLNGNVVIIDSHQKYIYGSWKDGIPEGINVYRGGETILIANFVNGKIVGKFLVIFESQGLMLTVQIERQDAVIIKKSQNINQEDIQLAGKEIIANQSLSQVLSLINYINQSYGTSPRPSGIQFSNTKNLLYFGLKNGLGILFGEDNFIHKVGDLSAQKQMVGVGGLYTSNGAKEGDFQSGQIITYKQDRPVQDLKYILHKHFLKSTTFHNSYLLTRISNIFNYINGFLKQRVISKIAQSTFHDSRRFNIQDFNDSLQYHPKDNSENQRLKKMRAELYLSIGRPGSEIKPVSNQMITEFIATEERQKNGKYSISNKYSHLTSKGSYGIENDQSRQLTARFEIQDYRKQSSPLTYKRNDSSLRIKNNDTSIRLKNPSTKALYSEAPGWVQECKRVIDVRKSRSPLKSASIYVPSKITQPIVSPQTSITFGNAPNLHPSSIHPSSIPNSSSVKYQDLKQKRARILNEYKNIGNVNKSSPPKLSPTKIISQSPYTDFQTSLKHSRRQSTDIKTISRRLDKTQVTPSRSPQKYSYLNSYM